MHLLYRTNNFFLFYRLLCRFFCLFYIWIYINRN
nr:MAG TPA: hypothetical protein [Bacteriophage sp.]